MSRAWLPGLTAGSNTARVPVLAAALLCCLSGAAGALAQGRVDNPINDQLLKLSPQEQAGELADQLGVWCIGIKPFFMGLTKTGAAKGYAYWSLTCAGGQSYMIQLEPSGKGAVIDCQTLKEDGQGRECYKTF